MKRLKECFRCEKQFNPDMLVLFESCWFCVPCYKIIKDAYACPNPDDYIHYTPKCRSCEE